MDVIGSIDPLYVLSGFCVGALVGMTGVRGGSLMTPLLILLFGIHPVTAVGTDPVLRCSDEDFRHARARLHPHRRLASRPPSGERLRADDHSHSPCPLAFRLE